jgi:hypothetical protein
VLGFVFVVLRVEREPVQVREQAGLGAFAFLVGLEGVDDLRDGLGFAISRRRRRSVLSRGAHEVDLGEQLAGDVREVSLVEGAAIPLHQPDELGHLLGSALRNLGNLGGAARAPSTRAPRSSRPRR